MYFIDAGHSFEEVCFDIDRAIEKNKNAIIIMDDFGHPTSGVRKAIDQKTKDGKIKIKKIIGEEKGFIAENGVEFADSEGVIAYAAS